SLDKLAFFLNKNELRILQCEFQNLSEEDFELLTRKGPGKQQDKLLATVYDKKRYVIHYRNLQQCMRHDLHVIDNVYGIPLANKKVPGLMKDENNDAILTEFIRLRAKMYALRVDSKKDIRKAKGIKSNIVARTITFDDYTRCLNDEIEMTRQQSCIRSKLHQVKGVPKLTQDLN
ncbi:hypothetical protein ALC56_02298, partial [Trachymyrmex septentrionalis]